MNRNDIFYISFVNPDMNDELDDDDLDVILNGEKLARWLAEVVHDVPELAVTGDPIMEDWGWVVPISYAGVPLFFGSYGCLILDTPDRAQMTIFYDGVFPWTRSRRRAAMDDLCEVLPGHLKKQAGVSDMETGRQPFW